MLGNPLVFSLALFLRDWAPQEFALVGTHNRTRRAGSGTVLSRGNAVFHVTTTISDGLAASIFRVVGRLPDFTVPEPIRQPKSHFLALT
jgi:hypothetical protein